jgi:DNA replicative helicase MCM subunit Mcm2 (Cdc46/Mcm family)
MVAEHTPPESNLGHYCRICGRERANERFSGKGHAAHVCKDCAREQKAKARREKATRKLVDSQTNDIQKAPDGGTTERLVHEARL